LFYNASEYLHSKIFIYGLVHIITCVKRVYLTNWLDKMIMLVVLKPNSMQPHMLLDNISKS